MKNKKISREQATILIEDIRKEFLKIGAGNPNQKINNVLGLLANVGIFPEGGKIEIV